MAQLPSHHHPERDNAKDARNEAHAPHDRMVAPGPSLHTGIVSFARRSLPQPCAAGRSALLCIGRVPLCARNGPPVAVAPPVD